MPTYASIRSSVKHRALQCTVLATIVACSSGLAFAGPLQDAARKGDVMVRTWRPERDTPGRLTIHTNDRRPARDYKAMADAELKIVARNREATARYGWSPYLHNPKLKGRLHRVRVPTLFLWGSADRVLSEAYGRAYCAAIAGAIIRATA